MRLIGIYIYMTNLVAVTHRLGGGGRAVARTVGR